MPKAKIVSKRDSRLYDPIGTDSKKKSKSRAKKELRAMSGEKLDVIIPNERQLVPKWNSVHKLDAKDGFEMVYGFSPDVYFTDNYNDIIDRANARKWWERSSAVTQCENTIGAFVADETECYICGLPIKKEPECEHILPVYKAALYLTLYRSEYKGIIDKFDRIEENNSNPDSNAMEETLTRDEQRIYDEVMMEYKWAHRCCNQKKGETDFIEYVEPTKTESNVSSGMFKLNLKNTKNILTSIANTALAGGDDMSICSKLYAEQLKQVLNININSDKKTKQTKIEKWVNNRIDVLQSKKTQTQEEGSLKTIIDYLNTYSKTTSYPLFTLINLCNIISSSDMNDIHTIWRRIEGKPPPIKETPPPSQITKAIVITELTRDFSAMCKFSWGRDLNGGVYSLYKNIFDIPDSIQIPTLTRNGSQVNMSEVIMFSLLDINKNMSEIGRFYRDFFSVITYGEPSLFPNDPEKAIASQLVGQCFKIMMIARVLYKINKFNTLDEIVDKDALSRFNVQFENTIKEECSKLKSMGKDSNQYCEFLKYFDYFIKTIDDKETLDVDGKQTDSIYGIITDYCERNIEDCNDISSLPTITPEIINNSVIKYYMDESEFLKNIPEWNPDVPEDDDMTTMLKGVAVGSLGLISLINSTEYLDDSEINKELQNEDKVQIINAIIDITTENGLHNKLLESPYFQSQSIKQIIENEGNIEVEGYENPKVKQIIEKNKDKENISEETIKQALNKYNNLNLSKIFIYLEKEYLMKQLDNIYTLKPDEYKPNFVNNLFTYYNLFQEIYQNTTRCKNDVVFEEFQQKWYDIINCMDVNNLASMIQYVEDVEDVEDEQTETQGDSKFADLVQATEDIDTATTMTSISNNPNLDMDVEGEGDNKYKGGMKNKTRKNKMKRSTNVRKTKKGKK
tara:strand:- start:707 stop:3433 length:2727 start_codon:yes stop_codon:yes gene_type:complete